MAARTFDITDGPDKPTLQRALTLPEEVPAHFLIENEGLDLIENEGLDVTIAKMEEQSDGFSFKLEGRVASGSMKHARFRAIYSIEGRSGSMAIEEPGSA